MNLSKLDVKGTRNLKQEVSSWATRGLTVEELRLSPRTESKSEGVALGAVEEESEVGLRDEDEEDDENE